MRNNNLAARLGGWQPNKTLGDPFIIAEAGVNHEGELDIAYRLIDEAKEGGADAIKFQTYRASTIASKNSPAYWDISKEPTQSQYELFKKYDRFWKDEFEQLKERCSEVDIEFLSTPFDFESAAFLNDLMDVFKISSSDITNKPFIQYIEQFGKPIVLSTGASTLDEIDQALNWINYGKPLGREPKVALLHCVLNYPTKNSDANLGMIAGLKSAYPEHLVGYSDHTVPGDMKVLQWATLLGAEILEKHFTHNKALPGNDHYHAMDWQDLIRFRQLLEETQDVLGEFDKRVLDSEEIARLNARRSIVAARVIRKGDIVSPGDLEFKRPGTGISPAQVDDVIGKEVHDEIAKDEILMWEKIK